MTVTSRTNGIEESLGDVVSASVEFQMDILTQSFLGETSDRKDDIFRGVRGQMEVQMESQDALRFTELVKSRAQRRAGTQTEVISITMTLNLPNGETPRVLLDDVYFGNVPFNVGGRDEYVTMSLEFEGSDGRVLYA